jgi:hypothetical protein
MADAHDDWPPERWACNQTTGRACIQAPFGVACYEGTIRPDGTFDGVHRGIVGTAEDADRWLRGETPEGLITVYD